MNTRGMVVSRRLGEVSFAVGSGYSCATTSMHGLARSHCGAHTGKCVQQARDGTIEAPRFYEMETGGVQYPVSSV